MSDPPTDDQNQDKGANRPKTRAKAKTTGRKTRATKSAKKPSAPTIQGTEMVFIPDTADPEAPQPPTELQTSPNDAKTIEGAKQPTTGKRSQAKTTPELQPAPAVSEWPARAGTPPAAKKDRETNAGDVHLTAALPDPPESRARARGRRWEQVRRQSRAGGMRRSEAIARANQVCAEEFPGFADDYPVRELPEPEPDSSPIGDGSESQSAPPATADQGVSGLGDLPDDWPQLPANASLQVEIAWVSANRLRVRDGTGVDLSRALSPAPSYAALSWLETSILFPSKFADISVKATAQQDDEREHIRREKMAIEEIRAILAEMLEG